MTKKRKKRFWWWNYHPDPKRKCSRCGKKVKMSSIRSGGWCFKCLCTQQDQACFLLGTFFVRQLTDEPTPDVFGFFQSLQSATRDAILVLPPGEVRRKLIYAFNIATRLTIKWGQEYLDFEGKPTTKAVCAIDEVFQHATKVGFINSLRSLKIVLDCVIFRMRELMIAGAVTQKVPRQVASEYIELLTRIDPRLTLAHEYTYPPAEEIIEEGASDDDA